MKRGYKKLLIFELFIFIILFLNSFVWNILSSYKLSIFILVVLFIFRGVFGFEKDKHRHTKDYLMEVIIFLISFFILYYLFGIIISFYANNNYYTIIAMVDFVIPALMYALLKEYFRYMIMCKAEGSKLLFITTVVMFVLFDITSAIYFRNFATNYNIFLFIALTLLPSISSNLVLCYFTTRIGYKPLVLYSIVMAEYRYLLPILPNPNEYLTSIINFMVPIALGYRFYRISNKEHEREISTDYRDRKIKPLIASTIIVLILVYFTSGYFHYWAIAVGSGSMAPKIHKGDVAIIEKIDGQYQTLEKGQVIAFTYDGIIIVHRLINIVEDQGTYYFYTKGDANAKPDNYTVKEDMILGIVNHRIPYIGIPTVWLNEL